MHGGGGGTGPGGTKKARIEIIPLIDVIFFLLATFVLFTITLNKTNGVKVQLPLSSTSEPREQSVTVSVSADGSLFWNKDPITLGEFLVRIKQYKDQEPDGRVLINGDERALFAQALYVFEQVRLAGFTKVFIETQVKAPTR